jgi:hypothetical protein
MNYDARLDKLSRDLSDTDSAAGIAQIWRQFDLERWPDFSTDLEFVAEALARTRGTDEVSHSLDRYLVVDAAVALRGIRIRFPS